MGTSLPERGLAGHTALLPQARPPFVPSDCWPSVWGDPALSASKVSLRVKPRILGIYLDHLGGDQRAPSCPLPPATPPPRLASSRPRHCPLCSILHFMSLEHPTGLLLGAVPFPRCAHPPQ